MPLMRNLNPGNQFAVNIDRASASYKLLYSHRDHIVQYEYVMFMEYLYYRCSGGRGGSDQTENDGSRK